MKSLYGEKTLFRFVRWLVLTFLLISAASSALAVKTYTDNGDGTVTDPTTGLTWMRCPMGQTWSGSTCTGTTSTYTWYQASALKQTAGGQSNWRLPNVRELQSIVDWTRFSPASNPVIFPANSNMSFWSATQYVYDANYSWRVDFSNGEALATPKSIPYLQARLVRGGNSSSYLSVARQDSDYTENGDGTVTHKPTGLMWKQCSEGQTWMPPSGCSGATTLKASFNSIWDISAYAGNSDWRVPTVEELLSMAEYTVYGAAVNPNLFPNTRQTYPAYCTATNTAISSFQVWTVDSYFGSTSRSNENCSARLVRAGQALLRAIPSAPSIGAVIPGDGSATVNISPPIYDGGVQIAGYTVISIPAGGIDSNAGTTAVEHIVTGLTNGTAYMFTVKATNSVGDSPSSAASSTVTPKTNQTIGAVGFLPNILTVGGSSTASAIATSGLFVTFSSSTPSICTVTGSTVTGLAAGICTVAADQFGNAMYFPAPRVTQDITARKVVQNIGEISFSASGLSVGGTATVSAAATSGLVVNLTSATMGICTISGGTVTGIAAGICTIAAEQAGDGMYFAASQVSQSIVVSKVNQSIGAISFTPSSLSVGATTTARAIATSGLAVNFSSTTPTSCSITGSIVTAIASGTCTVVAEQAGSGTYAAATQVSQNITVNKVSQAIGAISFTTSPLTVGGTATAQAIATSGLAVNFSSTTPTICSITGSIVTAIASGTCTIAAEQAGNGTYAAATQVSQNITVNKVSQAIGVISFTTSPLTVGGTATAQAIATSGLAVNFSSTTPTICSITGSIVTAIASGTCTIAAEQAGNGTYAAATQVSQSITVNKVSQAIGVIRFSTTSIATGGTTTATATATSGLGVTFSITTPSTCAITSSTLTGLAVGTCTVAANQLGNAIYLPALQVTQNITVSAPTTRLINLSTRGQVLSGDNVMIGGFIIQGSASKTVLIRAVGPTLANFGVSGVLRDPALQLFTGQTQIAANDDWQTASNAAAIQATTLAPSNIKESAILTTLAPGAYTAVVSGVGGATGVGIVEVYDIDHPEVPLINISTRGQVQTGDNVMIGGFIIQGTSPQTVLIRAVGPNLANFGVSGVLSDPTLTLYSGQNIIASNDNWQTATNAAAIQATTLAPVDPREAAILITLQPGAYTAVVSGANGGVGVGIIEVFAR